MFKARRVIAERAMGYATGCDFAEIFTEELNRLYLIAYLLTTDHGAAEQCILSALESCLKGAPVFSSWARQWSKRAVIKQAIEMASPMQAQEANEAKAAAEMQALSEMEKLVTAISSLAPFDRFVFVISTLEQYSDREVAALLNCSGQEIKAARTRAVQSIVVSVTHAVASHDPANLKEKLACVLRWPLRPQQFNAGEYARGEA
jgi:DNA-directed RNA polymerase specialized sigma24 family protein